MYRKPCVRFMSRLFKNEEVINMAMIYVSLIVKGKKTYSQVPTKLKQEVKQILIDIDCANLVEE